MRKSVFNSAFTAILVTVMILLSSCSPHIDSCRDALKTLCSSASLPSGELYFSDAAEGEEGYLSDELALTLYGESAKDLLALCEDYAIFLSERPIPCEAAVFKCHSASDCDTLSEALLSRIEEVRALLRDTELAGEYDKATVKVKGKYVFMVSRAQKTSPNAQ